MDSNLKVGSNNAGLFIGNTEILGGVQNITIGSYGNLIIVINRFVFDYNE